MTISDELRQKIIALHAKNLTAREAALEVGCSKGTVAGIWWKAGLRRKRSNLSPEELQRFQQSRTLGKRAEALRYERLSQRPMQPGNEARAKAPVGDCQSPPGWQARFRNPEDRRSGR